MRFLLNSHDCPGWFNIMLALVFGGNAVVWWLQAPSHLSMGWFAFTTWASIHNLYEWANKTPRTRNSTEPPQAAINQKQ